jgi:hypothetical protein
LIAITIVLATRTPEVSSYMRDWVVTSSQLYVANIFGTNAVSGADAVISTCGIDLQRAIDLRNKIGIESLSER